MSKKANLYLGKAEQMAVMSEFLARGRNVAVPEVDVGDDIFVVRDSDGNLSGIQVKTEIRNANNKKPETNPRLKRKRAIVNFF